VLQLRREGYPWNFFGESEIIRRSYDPLRLVNSSLSRNPLRSDLHRGDEPGFSLHAAFSVDGD
jgi:hypothetical protein